MGQSHKPTLIDWAIANEKLMTRFWGNKSELARRAKVSRTTVNKFFSEKPISEVSFRKVCSALLLNWQEVSSASPTSDFSDSQTSDANPSNKASIRQAKEHYRQRILEQHSRIRLLSGEELSVDQLYVDVWLLEKPERMYFDTQRSLLDTHDVLRDRLALSKRIRRNPGLEIASNNSKLVILGKPGSGKTTFLKHLAVDWCRGKFQSKKIAVLIELRRIQGHTWNLINVISRELRLEEKEIVNLLKQGKLLILMDGLDEVKTDELRRSVQTQVREISEQYNSKNRLILTCRTQIIGRIPNNFTSVEVADFTPEQVRCFVQNWFIATGISKTEATKQWKKIQPVINSQPDLREVTETPVLLSLICVVWQDSGRIPANRNHLYQKGINLLLSRWNEDKDIQDWEIGIGAYRRLSIEEKEALLIGIAAHKFENPSNFVLFRQNELAKQVSESLKLRTVQEGINVLRAIEAQHGLLIERADGLWSFSHLTFQEYFTVQWLTHLHPKQLIEKITNQQWQRIIEQLVKSQQPADRLLRLTKQAIDQSVAQETKIQDFLAWLLQTSKSHHTSYKPAAIRAFYCSLIISSFRTSCKRVTNIDLVRATDRRYSLNRTLEIVATHALSIELDVDLDVSPDIELDIAICRTIDQAVEQTAFTLDLDLARAIDSNIDSDYDRDLAIDLTRAFILARSRAIDHAVNQDIPHKMVSHLLKMKEELPTSNRSDEMGRWWSSQGAKWVNQLRQANLDYRNPSYDWKFTEEQQQELEGYYNAHKFLVNMIKIEGAVSEEGRARINEELLLLPWLEVQHY